MHSKVFLVTAADITGDDWILSYYLSKVYLKLHCFEDAVDSATSAKEHLPADIDSVVISNLDYLFLEGLSKAGTVSAAESCIELCEKVLVFAFVYLHS